MKKSKQLLLIMAFFVFTTNCQENSTENLKNNQEREKSIANKTNNSQVKIGTQICLLH